MNFSSTNSTIRVLDGRDPFQLSPSAFAELFLQSVANLDAVTGSDHPDVRDHSDDLKIHASQPLLVKLHSPRGRREPALRQHFFDHIPVHVRQSVIPALEAVGEPGVIKTEQVQQRCLQVVDVRFVLGAEVAEFVG
jgi:hypothetical protein